MSALQIQHDVPLSAHTTLELGGPAQHFAKIHTRDELLEALEWARARGLAVTVLGGGSNVVVSDRGVAGLVLCMASRGIRFELAADSCIVSAQAGEPWDALVARSTDEQLSGIECLSGIPGSVGAAPIQNIGAYGQEVGSCIKAVEVLDVHTGQSHLVSPADCGFAYRHSRWKRNPGREIVLAVQLELKRNQPANVHYAELARALGDREPSVSAVRQAVLHLRRGKSMLLEPGSDDPNRRSVGSFFLNPVVSAAEAQRIAALVHARGLLDATGTWPQYPQPDGSVKLSAAWLIERSGTHKGERHGAVGISDRHSLALVHHGGGTTQALLTLAQTVQQRVQSSFGVQLEPEPVRLGFEGPTSP